MNNRILCALAVITVVLIMGLHYKGVAFFEYDGKTSGKFTAQIISEPKEKEYYNVYTAKVSGKKFLLYIPKKTESEFKIKVKSHTLEYGDEIEIIANYEEPQGARNTGGFDYSLYLKTKKIYGIFKVEEIVNIKKNAKVPLIIKVQRYIKQTLRSNLKKENAELAIGLILGDKSNLSEEVQENFKAANLTHMLAISGAHFSYIILIVTYLGKKLKNKRLEQIVTIGLVIFFMNLTGNTPSVTRAGIMSILAILANMLKRRNDVYNSLSLSLLMQLAMNPYVIFDIGLMLSYSGVLGIVIFYDFFYSKIRIKTISVTLSANVFIIPIMIWNFNTISFSFVISNVLASGLLGIIIMLEFISMVIKIKPVFLLLDLSLSLITKIAELCAKIPFSKIYVTTNMIYVVLSIYCIIWAIYKGHKRIIASGNKSYKFRKRLFPCVLAFVFIFNVIYGYVQIKIKDELLINFIDVGQGDSCLIRYKGKSIMIDTGGSMNSSYDVGKSVLHRYLLNQELNGLDYLMLSHFDADHCQGGIFILQNMKVKNLIICKQAKDSELYREIIDIAKENKINVIYVQKGNTLNIHNLKIQFLHPDKDLISDNPLNNNAIVCKFIFYNFKILFTGDIEKIAEDKIKNEDLKADILKVGHHGSKTSTTQGFLDRVNPKIALIGVGENNKFGHPNNDVIDRLESKGTKIYRTDRSGEISIRINKDGRVRVKEFIELPFGS